MPSLDIERPPLVEYQRAFLYNAHRFTVTEAATKIGKTFSHSWWLFEQSHDPVEQGDEYLWLAPTYAQAAMVFEEVARRVAPTGVYKVNYSQLTITNPHGGILRYRTAEKPDNLYGPSNIRAIVGDEFTRWRPLVWPVVRSLATAKRCPVKLIGNYIGEDNWGHRLAKDNEHDPEWAYFRVNAWDAVKAGIMQEAEVESARRSLPPSVFSALYLCEGTADPSMLMDWQAINDLFTNDHAAGGERWMVIDVAGGGKDKTVISIWEGLRAVHWYVEDKSNSPDLIATVLSMSKLENIPRSRIIIDADGIGGMGLADHLPGCYRFRAQGKVFPQKGHQPNYRYLKDQCGHKLAEIVNAREIYIDAPDHRDTIAQELSWIRRGKMDHDGKLRILAKDKVKEGLGRSPDFGDNLMMRMVGELTNSEPIAVGMLERQGIERRRKNMREEIKKHFGR